MKLNQQLNLKEVLLSALKNKLSASDYCAFILYENWNSICGKEIGEKTKPKSFYKNVLTVEVQNPVLIFELGFIKEEFIKKINEFFSSADENIFPSKKMHIKDIRFINE